MIALSNYLPLRLRFRGEHAYLFVLIEHSGNWPLEEGIDVNAKA